ncbi:MAG TPA: 50S ribosomal protein L5 [Acidobacteriota bacterium]|nr:50S ribosomal protein L5 [Acidobacteriota bacterium]
MTTTTTTQPMRAISVEKVTLNCGCGTDHTRLEKSVKLLQIITGRSPVKTITELRIPGWGLRKGLPIGAKVTLRGEEATAVLKRLIEAREMKLRQSMFDNNGNIAFGVHEYIDIPGVEYDPTIGIIGLEVAVTLKRPGFRTKVRKYQNRAVPKKHRITQVEAIDFAKKEWGVKISDEEESE